MTRQIIDISICIENDVISDPPGYRPQVDYIDHQMSVSEVLDFFPGLAPADLPDGEGWAIERVNLITHNGTHLDAPWHFASTMDRGQPAITIDEVPLDWCLQPAVKLDFRYFADGYVVTADDVAADGSPAEIPFSIPASAFRDSFRRAKTARAHQKCHPLPPHAA